MSDLIAAESYKAMGMLTKLINVLIIILSLTLGFFFMFVGILKLTPAVKEDTHEEMVTIIFGFMS